MIMLVRHIVKAEGGGLALGPPSLPPSLFRDSSNDKSCTQEGASGGGHLSPSICGRWSGMRRAMQKDRANDSCLPHL